MKKKEGGFTPTRVTLIALLLSSMLILMGGAAVAPALNEIKLAFPGNDFLTSLIITLPSLAVAIVGYAIGVAADRFGKVRVLLTALTIFIIAGVAGYFLPTLETILVARFVLGIGIAGITSTVTALIAEYYAGIDRVRVYTGVSRVKVLSYQSAAMGIGVLILEFTGGSLAEISWRTPFLVYLIGIPILIMAILSMREPTMSERDRAELEEIAHEMKPRKVDRGIVALCYVSVFFCMNLVFLLPTSIPIVLAELGVSSSIVGLFLGFHGVANAVLSINYGRLTTRIPPFRILGMGFLCMGIGLAVLILCPSVPLAIFTLVITGMGVGMIVPSLVNTLAGQISSSNSGKIMGGYGTCLNFGQFAISLISVPLLAFLHDSYYEMYCLMGVIAVIYGIVIAVWSVGYYRRRSERAVAATE